MALRGIRGAITVKKDSKKEVLFATRRLLMELVKRNNLQIGTIAAIIFTTTKDIKSVFPAEAARQIGWKYVPLLCAQEIPVPKSLKKCVRVLMLADTKKNQKEILNVYLEKAKSLRKDDE